MSYLKGKTTYLVGNIHETLTNDYGVGWREKITPILNTRFNVTVLDPCKYGTGDTAQDQAYFKTLIKERKYAQLKEEFYRVIRKDLRCVDKADFIIFYHNPTLATIGSIHEIINATSQKKPVLILCDEEFVEKLNPWLLTLIKPQWFFTQWEDMFKYLDEINKNNLDTSHWW